LDRVKDTYRNIGLAVFSGAVTTLMAVTFLLFTKIYVLRKFGLMIQLTIGFSLLYALIIMPAFLALMGPNDNCGDYVHPIKVLYRKIKQNKKKESVVEGNEIEK
jgi:uncharacterized membrane protein YdfJ with MMPL/SSD domain